MSDSSNLEAAQANIDAAWGEHGDHRGPLRAELMNVVSGLEGVTGLGGGPGAERLVDAFLDFGEFHADDFESAAQARTTALEAEHQRDEIRAAMAPEEPPPVPAQLDGADDVAVRAWLLTANDAEVTRLLNEVTDRDTQLAWAQKFMGWARADGALAQVLAAINAVIGSGENPAEIPDGGVSGGVGATSTYTADADTEAGTALAEANAEHNGPDDSAGYAEEGKAADYVVDTAASASYDDDDYDVSDDDDDIDDSVTP